MIVVLSSQNLIVPLKTIFQNMTQLLMSSKNPAYLSIYDFLTTLWSWHCWFRLPQAQDQLFTNNLLLQFHAIKSPQFGISTRILQLGIGPFSQWSGLKHLGVSITPKSLKNERKCRCKGRVVQASLFGVGAPEALVIGVVALMVFGTKGLAEVARNLGKTLHAFQPTIRELQEVSREFKSSLEREIGLDEISSQTQNTYGSNRANTASTPSPVGSLENSQTAADLSEWSNVSNICSYIDKSISRIRKLYFTFKAYYCVVNYHLAFLEFPNALCQSSVSQTALGMTKQFNSDYASFSKMRYIVRVIRLDDL
ncbi:hypothetical protein GH714_028749 [Hevea brasiliensis]|uniref:Sec-independent protein translocase protein TATB, chloroplastic n=1 Tax=Hevea brasiliensis TaxID=3981 RepID=A0A6A6MIN7_HEVBR|nr:hypothetical protein GH714_028749 [Hevea brasiliensis]